MNFSDWRTRLLAGETITRTVHGSSMTPLISSGQSVTLAPVGDLDTIEKGDIVFCFVRGNYYVHLVHAWRWKRHKGRRKGRRSFLIGNNHGHVNGWTSSVYGKVVAVS